MYYYIYDNYLTDRRYKNVLANIESKLTDLGIKGKITRLSMLKNFSKTINDDLAGGIRNVIILGNDKTFNQVINLIEPKNLILGLIPIGPNNNIADILGIPEGEAACSVLSSRIIQPIHLAQINNHYKFITYLELGGKNLHVNIDNKYTLSDNSENNIISIYNNYWGENESNVKINNNSGLVNVIVKNYQKKFLNLKEENYSHFSGNKVSIRSSKSIPILLIDEKRIIKTPVSVTISPQTINVIVGKKRKF